MKKFLSMMCIMMIAIVTMVACKNKTTNGASPGNETDTSIADVGSPTTGFDFEKVLTLDAEYAFANSESPVFYEAQVLLDGYVDAATELNVVEVKTVFQSYAEPLVITIMRGGKDAVVEKLNDYWLECVPIKLPTALTLKDAITKLNEANIVKPHSKVVTLRNPLGPWQRNPQFIFGQVGTGFVAVDAKTGEVNTIE